MGPVEDPVDPVDPAMLTRPIAAAHPRDVTAPNAAMMVPRTEGRDGSCEPSALLFRSAIKEDHFFPSTNARLRN